MSNQRVWIDALPEHPNATIKLLRLTATGRTKQALELSHAIQAHGLPCVIVDGVTEEKARHFLAALHAAGGSGHSEDSPVPNPMVFCAAANRLLDHAGPSL